MKKLTNKELVKLYYDELWNKQNKDYIDILFDDNITFHGSLDIDVKGKEQFKTYMDTILTGIPNLFHSIVTMVCEGDIIAVKALYNGRHTGKLFEFEPSNNKIAYSGASFFKFRDGKIVDVWVLGDLKNLIKQLS
ncbi:MAG: ester cyclase [Arcobacter sp.]|jgi:predicted ester cyclase|uniref:ester cyclase n=1 Tax=Arcobacter sp. TaxID=1872629 RepID=UPI002A760775|nr:ester cyclase [Arcobacter sp.]MDY3205533.1 ester cyclase [Arcobacter sp.]